MLGLVGQVGVAGGGENGVMAEELLYLDQIDTGPVSYTHLRAHETVLDLVCRLLLENKQSISSSSRPII